MDKSNYKICIISVAPLRNEANDTSEMVSQLLFGEFCKVLDSNKNWDYIETNYDSYKGWIDKKQIIEVDDNFYKNYSANKVIIDQPFSSLLVNNEHLTLTIGAEILLQNEFRIGVYTFNSDYIVNNRDLCIREKIVKNAFKYINTPYLWGGKSIYGIDCSGFTQMVYKLVNIKLPRDAYQQAKKGEILSFVEEAEAGDLAFFENEEGQICHVGIILNNREIIHAHGWVRIDLIDNNGIFNKDYKKYTHKLRIIKKMIT